MESTPTCLSLSLALILAALSFTAEPAHALDPALAKICRDKAIEAFPTKPAGSQTGHAQAQRNYIKDCIAKDGKMDPEQAKKSDSPPPSAPK